MNPGVYPNVAFKDYLAINAVSNSYLGRLAECPAKVLVPREDTPSLILGRAVHKAVLEGHEAFNEEFAIGPEVDKRTRAGKEEWAAFEAENQGKQILKKEDSDKVLCMANAVFRHPWASKLLAENATEQTIIWVDKVTGFLCKARPDAVPDEGKMVLIDLKTTSDASEQGFLRSVIKYGYARGSAFYIDGYNSAMKSKIDSFIHIAVEPEEPYRTEIYILDNAFIDWGRQEYKNLLATEKDCRTKGEYPHYKAPYTTLNKPEYLY